MIVVAKARRLQPTVKASIVPLVTQLLKSRCGAAPGSGGDVDPLETWFTPKAAAAIREIEAAVRRHFLPESSNPVAADSVNSEQFSDLAAYFYLLLFRAVRQLLRPFECSNPTWLRIPAVRRRLRTDATDAADAFRDAVTATLPSVDDPFSTAWSDNNGCDLRLCDSRHLPVETSSVGGVLTSPPYLTRLDYAVSTAPELAVLGYTRSQAERLRRKMLGTTTVDKEVKGEPLGDYAGWCLKKIAAHESKASKSYYHKNIAQYLNGVSASVAEVSRVLAPTAPMVLVVQDSFYKDIHLDLSRIVHELGEMNGMEWIATHPFSVDRHLGRVHPHHRKHCSRMTRTESVVVMQKRAGEQTYAH
jgi:hypothetical protein